MPLYKRTPFHLAKNPEDLKPLEDVFQIRFTDEIFRDYREYLNRVNLYRQRVWTCRVSGKTNLTYEEALISEKRAAEKIQQFPEELVAPVLHEVQFSMLPMKDLVSKVAEKLLDHVPEGDQLHGKKNNRVYPCKIVKVVEEEVETKTTQYEVAWLDKDNKITGSSVVIEEDLIRKKLPFSRDILKLFIRESTYRNAPWVLHENLARKHDIPTDIPNDLRSKFVYEDGHLVANKKRSRNEESQQDNEEDSNGELKKRKGRKANKISRNEECQQDNQEDNNGELKKRKGKKANKISRNEECQQDNKEGSKGEVKKCRSKKTENKIIKEPIKYPIDDLLVKPAPDDPDFMDRPSPSRDFKVPIDLVGDLLMTWDFCSLFGKLLHLSPFSFEDFESALGCKDSNLTLIVESHSALLRLLIKDEGDYYDVIQEKKMKPKITPIKWNEYLGDFLEMINIAELSCHTKTIRRGHYGLLDIHAKLGILRELVGQALSTTLARKKVNEYVEQRRTLGATKKGEDMDAAKRNREDKERLQVESNGKETEQGINVKCSKSSSKSSLNGASKVKNGEVAVESNETAEMHGGKNRKKARIEEPKTGEEQRMAVEATVGDKEDSSTKTFRKLSRDDTENISRDQRKKYLEREMEKIFVRTSPLGKDRDHNRYWFFRRVERIFVESSDSSLWGYYRTKEELDAFMGSLNLKGERERALKKQLKKYYDRICLALQKKSKEVARNMLVEDANVRRSSRIRALPRENPALAFRKYINKWRED